MLAVMHLLRSQALGTEVMDEAEHHVQGKVADLLLDADRGKVIALLVRQLFSPTLLALQTQDILSWGARVHIREPEVLAPPEDIVRLQTTLHDRRPIIGQRIRTKEGTCVGRCVDLQFSTDHFEIEWIFPRKFLWKGTPLPASDILEITEEAIIMKDHGQREEKEFAAEERAKQPTLEPVLTPATRCSRRSCP